MATAIGAQILWGIFPAFIKLFQGVVEPMDLVAHRAIWSFMVLSIGLAVSTRWIASNKSNSLWHRITNNRATIPVALLATVFIGTNWLVFVWAVSNDHAIDASLGYYICPQFVVLLGVFFLRERLGRLQWIAIALATLGVTIMAWSAQSNIWIGLSVAIAFALYALIKKLTKLSAAEGLTLETGFMVLPAILFLCWRSTLDGVAVVPESATTGLLLILSGPLTVAPLFLYAIAVKHISLSTVGLLQFIGPTIQFFLGVFAFNEPFDSIRLIGFVFVWIGLGLYLSALTRRPVKSAKKPLAQK